MLAHSVNTGVARAGVAVVALAIVLAADDARDALALNAHTDRALILRLAVGVRRALTSRELSRTGQQQRYRHRCTATGERTNNITRMQTRCGHG